MKRLRAIGFLALALFCFLGSMPMYWMELKVIRHRMKERIEESLDPAEMVQFTFSLVNGKVDAAGLAFVRPDKEFDYEGHRYDIVHRQQTDTTVTYWVLEDELEERLVAAYQGNPDPDNPATNARRAFLKFFDKSFPNQTPELTPPAIPQKSRGGYPPVHYSQPILEHLAPPPWA